MTMIQSWSLAIDIVRQVNYMLVASSVKYAINQSVIFSKWLN
jgi:hypothetical protein